MLFLCWDVLNKQLCHWDFLVLLLLIPAPPSFKEAHNNNDFFFNKQDAQDILQTPDRANIPVICKRKKRRYRGHRAGCLVRIHRKRVGKLPLQSILLANVQSLDNKLDEV